MDVGGWLRSLGLGQYEAAFRDNEIDGEVLPNLTADDLKELGVVIVGHRRKLLAAIAGLSMSASHTPQLMAPAAAVPTAAPLETSGERRHLTVMFCDLMDSTGIAARLDAEEWRELVGGYLDAASAAVTEVAGTVAKKLGDGLMAVFGYPIAQENDAERAVRAALAIQRALADLNRRNEGTGKPVLAARIGLDAGSVVVDTAGEIFGDVPNVASRVQAIAEPGSVLVTSRVQRQVAGLFVAEERGSHELKGVPEPVALFRLVRGSGGRRRSGGRAPTPLIGRDEEIASLARRWERARQGDGQLVLVVGEPGLGKSRLVEEFRNWLGETPHSWVEWSASQLLQNTPLHPISEWGRQRFGGADVSVEQRLSDLETTLAQVQLDPQENVPLLAPLVDIPVPPERGVQGLSPEELRRRQLAAITAWVMAGARVQPVVLVCEDLHWADPTTLDVLRGIAERGALAPLFILATTRPEFRPPWGMRSHHATISLAPLDRHQVRHMVGELAARFALPQEVVEGVAARTGGVPLFIEEVTRLLLERGEQGGIQSIPPTLQQSLMARLDRLGPAREVAQIGAVLGRDFSYALLRAVAGLEEAPLRAALEQLADADILHVQGLPPDSDYRFKHTLIQDTAYENLLKSRRQILHRRVAETLRDRFAARAEAEPEMIAHHFTQAGLVDQAIEWWGKAGGQALHRSAFQEATSHLGKAVAMADTMPAGTTPIAARLQLQIAYGNALISARGHGAHETTAAFARARELTAGVEDAAERFSVYYGLWVGSFIRGELAPMQEISEATRQDAENDPHSGEAVAAWRVVGLTHWYVGTFVDAAAYFERSLATFDPERDSDLAFRFGQDAGVSAMIFLALALWPLGEVDRASRLVEEMIARAAQCAQVATTAYGRTHCGIFELMRGNPAGAKPHVRAAVDLAREHGMPLWSAWGHFLDPWAHWDTGDRISHLEGMRQGLALCRQQGVTLHVPIPESMLAAREAEVGQLDAALATVDHAIAEIERTGQRWFQAEAYRIRGEILLERAPLDASPAEAAFGEALVVARRQKARSFELRAALSLANLYRATNRNTDARAVLVPSLEGFSPTPEFPEIQEAVSLLVALNQ